MKVLNAVFFAATLVLIGLAFRFFAYTYALSLFPYEWEPTDGDHFNFISRIMQGKFIYLDKDAGWVLSIYNPLYHYTVAGISALLNAENALAVGRRVSIFFLLAPIFLFGLFNLKSYRLFPVVAFFSFLLLFPCVDMFLLDMNNVSPNSMLFFSFALAGLLFDSSFRKNAESITFGILFSILAVLVYLSKQQGFIIFPIYGMLILLEKSSVKSKIQHLAALAVVIIVSVTALELMHGGLFLKSTFVDAGKMVSSNYGVSRQRMFDFFIFNPVFLGLAGIVVHRKYKAKELGFWDISFLIHVPFLLKILGNAGGGNNYFGTFWITIVALNFAFFRDLFNSLADRKKTLALCALFTNVLVSGYFLNRSMQTITAPAAQNFTVYETHKKYLADVMQRFKSSPRILAYRNVGALVELGYDVNIEGATTFNYLWSMKHSFDSGKIAENIKRGYYDVIYQGLQPYPKDILENIKLYYRLDRGSATNLYYNNIGDALVYLRKDLEKK